MAQLIRDLIEIPEQVFKGDFVLKLAEGLERSEETLRDYVVTAQLADCFRLALGIVKSAVERKQSKAAYLHGSFGSGKSHFMAVLHLLLQHDVAARSIPELAPVLGDSGWAEGKKFLLVPYHLIGANNLEEAVLGHYVEHIRKLRPEAPLPAVFMAEGLFADASKLRMQLGDGPFFEKLNEGKSAGGWGSFGAGSWDAERFGRALKAPPNDSLRLELVGDLVAKFFSAYERFAASQGEGYVSLDAGLSVISKHAKELGYDAVVLFLDELILWLASRVTDLEFVSREGSKLAKLVEAEHADRPVPIISFVARQRDLRELVGNHLPGAEKLSFSDTLKWWEGRFEKVTLEDQNLAEIASRRLLRPKNEEAKRALDAAFAETKRVRDEVFSTLVTSTGNEASFRSVYPFSPALVQALVALSSALQRERTALRVMLQLLVDQRDTLRLGDLVPVGDLYDVIASGDEPFTEEMRIHFEHAKKLYAAKLQPELERQHGLTKSQVAGLPFDDARAAAFRGDDRIIKTLLLGALVPDVEVFRGLTAATLSALNHGSIRSPIPGNESKLVLSKCRQWATRIGEIKIGEGSGNPSISIQLSGVDTEAVLEGAAAEDNFGNRKRTLKQLLFQQLGVEGEDDLYVRHEILWRGTKRGSDVVFANIRELAVGSLRARSESDWKVVIDFPFDSEGHGAKDDLARLEEFRGREGESSTLCWVPTFLSQSTLQDLGRFVRIEFLLASEERLKAHASHLSATDRAQARALLDNQRTQLKQRLISALEAAYGVTEDRNGLTDGALDLSDRFQSLDSRFSPQPPAAANLGDAFSLLLAQILGHRLPDHPEFEMEVRSKELKKVLEVASRAAHSPAGRVEVVKEDRSVVRAIANPLGLGEMHEAAFVLGDRWRNALTQAAATAGVPLTVRALRPAFDLPRPRGLTREVQDLLLLVFAEQTNRSFFLHGGAVRAELGAIDDGFELRAQQLPTEADWKAVGERAAKLFGLAPGSFLSTTHVTALEGELREIAKSRRGPCAALVEELERWMKEFGPPPEAAPRRLQTARAALAVVQAIEHAPADCLRQLLDAGIPTTLEAMATSGRKAEETVAILRDAQMGLLRAVQRLGDHRAGRAEALLGKLREALGHDELAIALVPVIREVVEGAAGLLAEAVPVSPPLPSKTGWTVAEQGERELLGAEEARAAFLELEKKLTPDRANRRLLVRWAVEERKGGS